MKRILIALIVLISFSCLAEVFAEDVCAGPQFSGPILLAEKDKTPCVDACKTQRALCKDDCGNDNRRCQKGCADNEGCIDACGKTYIGCAERCPPIYLECFRACPRSETLGK